LQHWLGKRQAVEADSLGITAPAALASLIPRARDLHGYPMLIYGTADDNVHPQNEEAFMNALIAAGKPYEVELFPMRKHGFLDTPALIQRYNAMAAFWDKNL
jgi:dipeptidyl-peptidase 4